MFPLTPNRHTAGHPAEGAATLHFYFILFYLDLVESFDSLCSKWVLGALSLKYVIVTDKTSNIQRKWHLFY